MALASVINPSLARISYARHQTQPPPENELAPVLPAPEQSQTWKSAGLAPSIPTSVKAGRPSLFAVVLTPLVGLAAGALLHRAGSGLSDRASSMSASTVSASPAVNVVDPPPPPADAQANVDVVGAAA